MWRGDIRHDALGRPRMRSVKHRTGHRDVSHHRRMIGLAALAIFLVWEVGSRSVVAYLADSAPEIAVRLRPQEPTALLNLAERELTRVGGGKPEKPVTHEHGVDARVRTWAESALLIDPLNAKALRILGQFASGANSPDSATKYMRASARNSIHEGMAVYWTMQDSAEKHDFKTAIRYADALLRTRPSLMSYVAPTLEKMAENKDSNALVKRLLYDNPPWRAQFFGVLLASISDARTPLDLLLSLKDGPSPASPAELQPFLAFLIQHKLYDLAYYTWLQFLPPAQLTNAGLLFNGSFEFAPSGFPFDWTITSGAGMSIEIVPTNEKPGEHALLIEFGHGRVDYRSIAQMTMLTSGSYLFYGKYKGDLVGPRGLKWRIHCADAEGQAIGESEMIIGVMPSWKEVRFHFTVPESDCRAQYVRLDLDARMASERLVAGAVWLDELQIAQSDDAHSK